MTKEKKIYTQDGTFEFSFEIRPENTTGVFEAGFKDVTGGKSFYFKGDKGLLLDSDGNVIFSYRDNDIIEIDGSANLSRVAYYVNDSLYSTDLTRTAENIDTLYFEKNGIDPSFVPEVKGKEAEISFSSTVSLGDNLQGNVQITNDGDFDLILSNVEIADSNYVVVSGESQTIQPSQTGNIVVERTFEDAPGDEFNTNWQESVSLTFAGNFGRQTRNIEFKQEFPVEASFSIEGGNSFVGDSIRTLRVNYDVSRGSSESSKRLPVTISFEALTGRATTTAWDVLVQRPGKIKYFSFKDNDNIVDGDYLNEKSQFFVNESGFFRIRIQRFSSGDSPTETGKLTVKIGEIEEVFDVEGSG